MSKLFIPMRLEKLANFLKSEIKNLQIINVKNYGNPRSHQDFINEQLDKRQFDNYGIVCRNHPYRASDKVVQKSAR
jgi:hypothetical protein